MMVVFKSAPILKRALKVREENLQLYALKVFEKKNLSKDSFILRFESKFIVKFTLYTNLRKSLIREFGRDRNFIISIMEKLRRDIIKLCAKKSFLRKIIILLFDNALVVNHSNSIGNKFFRTSYFKIEVKPTSLIC